MFAGALLSVLMLVFCPLSFVITDCFTSTCAFAVSTRLMASIPTKKNTGVISSSPLCLSKGLHTLAARHVLRCSHNRSDRLFTCWFTGTRLMTPLMFTPLLNDVLCCMLWLRYCASAFNCALYPSMKPAQKLLLCGPFASVHLSYTGQNGL